ncbi:phosphatase PAP2 family protein [Brachybacterium sp. FME24]|uniref:phosphatase PAP2 family protein n=1 Tax=Brachybacterium sp. FME24 TaxID=2742605 RepID=UPI002714B267|nr:phosphatase PAP2 family protein [Brachybacterium sp. FME24]
MNAPDDRAGTTPPEDDGATPLEDDAMTPPPRPGARTRRRRTGALARPLLALLCAVIGAGLAVLLARTSVGTASGQRLDQLILSGAQDHQGRLSHYAELAVGTVSVPVMAGLLALALVLVLIRRRLTLLLPLALLVVGANVTTQVVKHLVVTREALGPGIEVTPNSFPSGHTTLAATAMIAVVLASGRLRALLAPLGVIWTAAAGVGTLVLGWHRPSDVVGAIVIVAGWTVLVLAIDGLHTRHRLARDATRPGRGRRRRDASRAATGPSAESPTLLDLRTGAADRVVAVLLGLAGLAGVVYGAIGLAGLGLPLDLQDAAQQTSSFVATAALIAGGTASWMALVLVLRTPTSHRSSPGDRVP